MKKKIFTITLFAIFLNVSSVFAGISICKDFENCSFFTIQKKEAVLIPPDKQGKITKYISEIKKAGYRPATPAELAAFTGIHEKSINRYTITSIAVKKRNPDGTISIPFLSPSETFWEKWDKDEEEWLSWCRFLFIKE